MTAAVRSTTSPALPQKLAWLGLATLGLNVVRVGEFAVSDMIFFLLTAVLVVKLLNGDRSGLISSSGRRGSQFVLGGSIILLTAGVVSSFVSFDIGGSLLVVVRLGYLTLLWFWVIRAVCPDRRALNVLVGGWRFGLLLTTAIGILAQVGLLNVGTENAEGRQTAFFTHYNDFGGYLAIGLPLLVLGIPRRTDQTLRREMTTRVVGTGVVLYAVSTSGSISSLITAAVSVAVVVAAMLLMPTRRTTRRSALTPLAVGVVALAGGALLVTSDLPVFERIDRYSSGDAYVQNSVDTRGELTDLAINQLDSRMIVGIGMDKRSTPQVLDISSDIGGGIHSMYLKTLVEAGLIALIGLILVLYATVRCGVLLVRNTRGSPLYPIAVGCLASAAAALFFALFGPILIQRYFWLPMAMIGALWSMRREELRLEAGGDPTSRDRVRFACPSCETARSGPSAPVSTDEQGCCSLLP